MNKEFNEGYASYHYGGNQNPYKQKTEEFKRWWSGWGVAEDEENYLYGEDKDQN